MNRFNKFLKKKKSEKSVPSPKNASVITAEKALAIIVWNGNGAWLFYGWTFGSCPRQAELCICKASLQSRAATTILARVASKFPTLNYRSISNTDEYSRNPFYFSFSLTLNFLNTTTAKTIQTIHTIG